MSAFDTCYASVLKAEGGFVNNLRDPGGMTNLGVTRHAWEAWLGHKVLEKEMRALTSDVVSPFYRANYWNAVHCDNLPPGLALCMFHCSVNAGPKRAANLLQSVVKAAPDGSVGPETLQLVRGFVAAKGEKALVHDFQEALRSYYRSLSTFDVFGKGWMNRATLVETQAMGMIK